MSFSSASSFSVMIRIPVAWGEKTCTIPFRMFALATASWTWSVRSMKSISPCVEKLKLVLTILKRDITFFTCLCSRFNY